LKHKLLIIGGGAAGLTAAIAAKDAGIDTAVLEANDRVGKKILTTGNGRCNFTNEFIDAMIDNYPNTVLPMRYHSDNKDFFFPVLRKFTVKDTINLFSMLGLPLTTLEDGKMYPMSLQASSVLDVFRMALSERELPVYTGFKVTDIKPVKAGFKVYTRTQEGESVFSCDKLILCAGGKSAPTTGSDGSGYSIAKKLGHSIIPTVPALVQLKLNYKNLKGLSGIKFDGFAEILVDNASCKKEFGEILFTDYGISGPPVLQLSRTAAYMLSKHKDVLIRIDMLPHMSPNDLESFLETHWAMFGHRTVTDSFIGIINKKLIPILLKEAGIENIHKPCWELEWNEKKNIYSLLKSWEFSVTDTNSYSNSQVTAGGVDTREVDSETLESKLVSGLYFAGEILDVDGDCGGFNLQWAWSSGYVAATSCAAKSRPENI
jgi:predicted Rossmann fold flavoprotein